MEHGPMPPRDAIAAKLRKDTERERFTRSLPGLWTRRRILTLEQGGSLESPLADWPRVEVSCDR